MVILSKNFFVSGNIAFWRPQGVVEKGDLTDLATLLANLDSSSVRTIPRFIDLSGVTKVLATQEEISGFAVSRSISTSTKNLVVIYANDKTMRAFARMYSNLLHNKDIMVEIVDSVSKAAKLLNVTEEFLRNAKG